MDLRELPVMLVGGRYHQADFARLDFSGLNAVFCARTDLFQRRIVSPVGR
ncbi:hypothetical protein M2341_001410 [Sphingobium sp. B7D2B]|nr:hypothetical protein [Sphingobium sp. B7D2B]